jgi:hypothetical protein
VNDRNSPLATLTPDLRDYDFAASDQWVGPWRLAKGKTKTASLVARPFRDLKFLQVRRPAAAAGSAGSWPKRSAASASPTTGRITSLRRVRPTTCSFKPLPNQTGTSKDLGFWMTMLDGKLSIRYTHFDTKQLNLRNGDITTMAQRILRYEGFIATDAYNLRTQTTAWLNGLGTGGTATNAQIAAAIKMPLDQYNGLQTIAANNTYAAVMDAESKGHELEINYNPTKNWTVSASVTKTTAINTAAGSAVDDYIARACPFGPPSRTRASPRPRRPSAA